MSNALEGTLDQLQQRQLRQRATRARLVCGSKRPILTVTCVILFLMLLGVLASVKYRELLPVPGVMVNALGDIKVSSPQSGVVTSVSVTAGEFVRAGTVLLMISSSRFDATGKTHIEQERDFLHAQKQALLKDRSALSSQFDLQKSILEERVERSELRLIGIEEATALHRRQLDMSKDQLDRLRQLTEEGGLSQFEFERGQINHFALLSEETSLNRQGQDVALESQGLRAQLVNLEIEFDRARRELEKHIASLEFQEARLQSSANQALVAYEDGIVSSLVAEVGDEVVAGKPLVILHPVESDLLATVFVPGSAVGKLEPGQKALLRYDSFDYHSYGRYEATIVDIERSALDPREHLLPLVNLGAPVFRVTVRPSQHYVEGPEVYPVLPGMTLTADFVLDELTLLQFIFKPFLTLNGRIS